MTRRNEFSVWSDQNEVWWSGSSVCLIFHFSKLAKLVALWDCLNLWFLVRRKSQPSTHLQLSFSLLVCAFLCFGKKWQYSERKLFTFPTCDFNWDSSFVVWAVRNHNQKFHGPIRGLSTKILNFHNCYFGVTQFFPTPFIGDSFPYAVNRHLC